MAAADQRRGLRAGEPHDGIALLIARTSAASREIKDAPGGDRATPMTKLADVDHARFAGGGVDVHDPASARRRPGRERKTGISSTRVGDDGCSASLRPARAGRRRAHAHSTTVGHEQAAAKRRSPRSRPSAFDIVLGLRMTTAAWSPALHAAKRISRPSRRSRDGPGANWVPCRCGLPVQPGSADVMNPPRRAPHARLAEVEQVCGWAAFRPN